MYEKKIKDRAASIGLELDEEKLEQLTRYKEELLNWNKRINLISRTEAKHCDHVNFHLVDSMTPLLSNKIRPGIRLVDVGTGAGLPGLVLKILEPDIELTLVESVTKKCVFLRSVCATLGLKEVEVVCERAEDYGRGAGKETFDVAVARAVAPLPVLLELCLPLLKTRGYLIAQKGKQAGEETAKGHRAAEILGGKVVRLQEVTENQSSPARVLVLVEKVAPTPAGYPRKAGLPAKRPLGSQD